MQAKLTVSTASSRLVQWQFRIVSNFYILMAITWRLTKKLVRWICYCELYACQLLRFVLVLIVFAPIFYVYIVSVISGSCPRIFGLPFGMSSTDTLFTIFVCKSISFIVCKIIEANESTYCWWWVVSEDL